MAGFSYEWDDAKRAANLAKHGVDFLAAVQLDWERALVLPDARRNYGEERLLAYCPLDGRLHAVVFIERGRLRRIISMRRANRREQAAYAAERVRRG